MPISKLQDSISILITLQAAIDECLKIISKEKDDKASIVHAFADGYLVLLANSFMVEWENLGSQCKDDDRVVKLRKVATPFTRRVKKWDDIGTLRNTLVAHGYRSNGTNVLLQGYSDELNVPNGFPDRVLLGGCIYCIKELLVTEFADEYNALVGHLQTLRRPILKEGLKTEKEATEELRRLIDLSESIRADLA